MPTVPVQQAFAQALEHHRAGRLRDAEALYREILAAQPDHADALHFLGVIAHQCGRHELAVEWIHRALALDPNNPAAYTNLGETWRTIGRFDEATACFRRALQLKPESPEAHYNLGTALAESGQFEEAMVVYRRALEFKPNYPEAHNNLGNALQKQGHMDEAVAAYRRALQLNPGFAAAYNNLAGALTKLGQPGEAMIAYRRALQLQPDYADAHYNLGNILREDGQLDEAVLAYHHALRLKPDAADAYCNLGVALANRGQLDEAMAAYRWAIDLKPSTARYLSNLIYALQFDPAGDGGLIREQQALWNRRHVDPLQPSWRPYGNVAEPLRRLRIGYVSPSFHSNAVAFFLLPLLEAHDHHAYEVYCYASVRQADAVTERFRNSADVWRDIRALPDVQLAERVGADGIDILVDLGMHSGDNRLPLFAHKPAPVQVSWLAYPGSTGLETIDYRLTDAHIDPPGQEDAGLREEAIRLPDAWCCYEPIEEFPLVGLLPALGTGTVTFGSLNQFNKINEVILRCWARLLAAVPESRLLMICPVGQAREQTHALFAAHGIAKERVELVAQRPWAEYIRLFERIDLALDTYPHNGMTTTCHTLWMGVPVVTRAGMTAVSRAGSSLLHTIGLPEWVARSEDEYIRIAVEWAGDLPRLAELRATLRARMQASPLMDAPRFARNIEAAYRTMWVRWCARQPAE